MNSGYFLIILVSLTKQTEAEKLKSVTPRDVPSAGLLYVNQREYAVVSEQNGKITEIQTYFSY